MFRQLIGSEAEILDSFSVLFPGEEVSLNSPKQLFVLSPSHIAVPQMTQMGLTTSISSKIPFIAPAPVTFPVPSFIRASVDSFVNSQGLIEIAPPNTPRFDHDPVTLATKGLLLEEVKTHLVLQSRDLSHASWGKTRITVTTSTNFPIFANMSVFLVTGNGVGGDKSCRRLRRSRDPLPQHVGRLGIRHNHRPHI